MISEVNEIQIYTSVKTENTQEDQKIKNRNEEQSISELMENEQKLSKDKDSSSNKVVNRKAKLEEVTTSGKGKDLNGKSVGKEEKSRKMNGKVKDEVKEVKDVDSEKNKEIQKDSEELIRKSLNNVEEKNTSIKQNQEIVEPKISKGGLPSNPVSPPSTPSHPPQIEEMASPVLPKLQSLPDKLTKNNMSYYLYAIFIHKGTAYAGHYYIYIKSFETNQWYLFDDSQVTEVNLVNVLRDSVGGGSSPANAYMLAYRKAEESTKASLQPADKVEKEVGTGNETANETLSLGHIESSNKKTDTKGEGRKREVTRREGGRPS